MEFTRYILALFMLMALPCAILYWFIIHPFANFWRRHGAFKTQLFCSVVLLAVCAIVFLLREPLLGFDFGFHWSLAGPGLLIFVIGLYFEYRCRKHLKLSTLLGGPELSPEKYPGRLLNQGIYSEVRHPRYLAAGFGCAGIAMVLNYPWLYLFTLFFVVMLYPLILIEERELRERFGADYIDYSKTTPRLVPKWMLGQQTPPNDPGVDD